jgi:pimeloyl-ACP methyl ester carboxylesterase
MDNFSTAREYLLDYRSYGFGTETLVAFHGYGQEPSVYGPLGMAMQGKHKVISVGLPGHGKSGSLDDFVAQPLSCAEMAAAVDRILNEEGASRVHLLGYSLGGRMAMNYFLERPEKAISLNLLAPDGFRKVRFRNFATRNLLGRVLFRFSIHRPGLLFATVITARKLRIIPRSTHRFVFLHLRSRERRQNLFKVWMSMRSMDVPHGLLVQQLKSAQIPVRLIFGERDRIIPERVARRFLKALPQAGIFRLKEGHNLLRVRNVEQIAGIVADNNQAKNS